MQGERECRIVSEGTARRSLGGWGFQFLGGVVTGHECVTDLSPLVS